MSGENVLPFVKKTRLEESLRIEDDKRLYRCVAAGSVAGIGFAAWALTVSIIIPVVICVLPPPDGGRTLPYIIKPPDDIHRKLHGPPLAKHHAPPGETGHHGRKPVTDHPAEVTGTLGQNVVTSRRGDANYGAYDLLGKTMRDIDMDKLLGQGILKRTPHSENIGGRRAPISHEFNVEYRDDGDCLKDCDAGVMPTGIPGGPIPTATRHPDGPAKNIVIDHVEGSNARSTASILSVIRSHSPGLRHVYNGYLMKNPGFAGKIDLRFEIAPSGDIVDLSVASSSTGMRDFDADIVRQVKSWRFDAVKAAGNDLVTVPFTFSE